LHINNRVKLSTQQKILTIEKPTQKEFKLFSELVLNDLGLEWGDGKKYLLHARVQRRLQILKIQTFEEYYNFIDKDENNSERQYLYNAVTTTKSGFYREKQHFDYLRENIFPELKKFVSNQGKNLRFWSAGCSTGEEAYTLAMETHDTLGNIIISGGRLRILGSDINTDVLDAAKNGKYNNELVKLIPEKLRNRYFLAETQRKDTYVQIKQNIKDLIQFRHFNLLASEYPIATKFQLIFCRNVLYYLDPKCREKVIRNLIEHLDEGGYLVLGITESGYKVEGVEKQAYSIYRKT